MNENSNAERQKRYREKQKALRMGSVTGEEVTASVTAERSETDKLFEQAMPRYYIFSVMERDTNREGNPLSCWMCGKAFKTRLQLNRFCSPKCKDKFLHGAMRAKPD